MSTRFHLVPLALSLLLGLPACATRQSMGEQVDDATLQMRVGRALIADPQTSRMGIDVDVVDGVVYLKGDVESEEEKMQAARVAANTVGVKEVKNDLQIEGMMPEGEDARSDIGIRTSVGTRLMADPDTSRMNIDVDVVNGVVYLTGIVGSEREKKAAERIVRGVEGVQDVKNQLQVEQEGQSPAPGGPEEPANEEGQQRSQPEEGMRHDDDDMDMDMDAEEPTQPE